MRKTGKGCLKNGLALFLATLFFVPTLSYAVVDMKNFCVSPAFISTPQPPNFLLMIDNSSSMYDLAYVDKGKKHCAANALVSCTTDSDCAPPGPGGVCGVKHCYATGLPCTSDSNCIAPDVCTAFDRQPSYCYDETYKSTNNYFGYFEQNKFYYFRPATNDFVAEPTGYTFTCTAGAYTTKTIANTLCLQFTPPSTLVGFVANGNFLNWLTASKFDVEKKILTGGKYDGSALIPESRGCVGQGYVKDVDTADFINYNYGATNPNVPLGVTFTITGPSNPNNLTAPSQGGQTKINIYSKEGQSFNYQLCQTAIQNIATGNNAEIKQSVAACLQSTGSTAGSCKLPPLLPAPLPAMSCATNSDCYLNKTGAIYPVKVCNKNTGQSCTLDGDCTIPPRLSCTLKPTMVCTIPTVVNSTECDVLVPEKKGTCSTLKTLYSPLPGKNDDPPPGRLCILDSDCNFKSTGTNYISNLGACVGYAAARTDNFGRCDGTLQQILGPCVANYVGDCITSAQAAAVKTKVAFQQSMQECWTIRGTVQIAPDYGFPNANTIKNMCPDIYANYKTCQDDATHPLNHLLQCTSTLDCPGSTACQGGPTAIAAGNPALLCGTAYAGAFYTADVNGNWILTGTDSQLKEAEYRFCNDMQAPPVVDPTDSPSDTATADNLPSILSGLGVEAQLGVPVATVPVKVTLGAPAACTKDSDCGADNSCQSGGCRPSGLIQEFGSKMRIGAMSFNPLGSKSEALPAIGATLPAAKICFSGITPINPPYYQSCIINADCGSGNTCQSTSYSGTELNLDGGKVNYPIGNGKCTEMAATACTSDASCTAPAVCIDGLCGTKSIFRCTTDINCSLPATKCVSDGVGAHTIANSLINVLDSIPGRTWTPFSEAFYNAIGYFARTGTGASNSSMRLNTDDFNANDNPSQYTCQQNYILLITDGASTADRNSTVSNLSKLYSTVPGLDKTATWDNTCPSYGGSINLPILSYIARHRNIASFSTVLPATLTVCSGDSTRNCNTDYDCVAGQSCLNAPRTGRDFITTYVVLNGEDNGVSGECNSKTMLSSTATNGGTVLKQATNPTELKNSLVKIFEEVSAKTASGTAASILSNSEGSGANILQAVFFPKKIFDNSTNALWLGEMQNLWYYLDPFIGSSTVREDTSYTPPTPPDNIQVHLLDLIRNYVVKFQFNNSTSSTDVNVFQDTNGDGLGDVFIRKEAPDDVKSIWRAGEQLWKRDISSTGYPRKLLTPITIGGTELTTPGGDATGMMLFPASGTLPASLIANLQKADNATALKLTQWVHGFDFPGDSTIRNRTVKKGNIPSANLTDAAYTSNPGLYGIGVWKLGDIISSTPRLTSSVKTNNYDLPSPAGYADNSYAIFAATNKYKERGMVYVGANDGMLHAFKLGTLDVTPIGTQKATLKGPNLGEEQWAFIPKNVLPYLTYLADPLYTKHLYLVDGSTSILDASIGGCGGGTNYYDCPRAADGSTWRTILIAGMGIGGASHNTGTIGCTEGVTGNCVMTPLNGVGYSSYFALDITNEANPILLWEFSDADLDPTKQGIGFATSNVATVRISARTNITDPNTADRTKNGRWFAVMGSGPTGPIDSDKNRFMGSADKTGQTLKIYVKELAGNSPPWVIDSGIPNAFVGSMSNSTTDVDRWDRNKVSNYQDDVLYFGYVEKDVNGQWRKGGVLRLVTGSDPNPANWKISKVVEGIGPVVSAIARLQDRKNKKLWLFFGEGRYYYNQDDYDSTRNIFGIYDPCYKNDNTFDDSCLLTPPPAYTLASLSAPSASVTNGWYITLDPKETPVGYGAERVITDTVAMVNGGVFYTSFKPAGDPCLFGGYSYLWAVRYDTGLEAPPAARQGKALVQVSTGEFKEIDLSTAFTEKGGRRMSTPMTGKPPGDAPPLISKGNLKPVKKILHIQEH